MRIILPLLLVLLAGCGQQVTQSSGTRLCAYGEAGCVDIYDIHVPETVLMIKHEVGLSSYQVGAQIRHLLFEPLLPGEKRAYEFSRNVEVFVCVYKPGSGFERVAVHENPGGGFRRRGTPRLADTVIVCPVGPEIGTAKYAIRMSDIGKHGILSVPSAFLGPETQLMFCQPGSKTLVPPEGQASWVTPQIVAYYRSQGVREYVLTTVPPD